MRGPLRSPTKKAGKSRCAHQGEKKGSLAKTAGGYPTKKAGKSRKKQLVFIKGEYVFIKKKRKGFGLKLIKGLLWKRLETNEKRNLCLGKEICAHQGEKKGSLTKTAGGYPTKKAGKSRKKQLVFMKGGYVFIKKKRKGFGLKLIKGLLRKRLENHEKRNWCLGKEICAHQGEKKGSSTKTDRGSPTKKVWK